MKKYKQYLLFLGILILLSPLGIIIPNYVKSGDAWGEWSLETVKEQVGYEPQGMKDEANAYAAPISDYNLGTEKDSLAKKSASYILSGVVGLFIILLFTFGAYKIAKKKQDA